MNKRSLDKKRLLGTLLFFLLVSVALVLAGRGFTSQLDEAKQENCSITGFAFDTTYTITLYEGGSQQLLNRCTEKCAKYEQIFSRTRENSEVYQINLLSRLYEKGDQTEIDRLRSDGKLPAYQELAGGGLEVEVSQSLAELIAQGIRYGEISKGAFDITIEPVSSLWNFTADSPVLPEKETIRDALPYVDYSKLKIQDHTLQILKPGMGLDLGGIAKGYIADQLKSYLVKQGVTSGLINLGGNVLCIGEKPDGSDFQIGIQYPFADRNKIIATVAVKDVSVVSSGIYERYFTENDTIYHHILDPQTGYPRENDLLAVTIISDQSVDGDGLSTTCFGLGVEEGKKLIDSMEGVTAVFITRDEKLHYADGFQKLLVPR